MPAAKDLIREIETNISSMRPYSNWTIGATSDPDRRHRELDYPGFWRFWLADDEKDARQIVEHFVTEGARRDDEDSRNATFVYMF